MKLDNCTMWNTMWIKEAVDYFRGNWFWIVTIITAIWVITSLIAWFFIAVIEDDTRYGIDHKFKHEVQRVEACEENKCRVRLENGKYYENLNLNNYPGQTLEKGDKIFLEVWYFEYHTRVLACSNNKCVERNTCWIVHSCWKTYKGRIEELMALADDGKGQAIRTNYFEKTHGLNLYDPTAMVVL